MEKTELTNKQCYLRGLKDGIPIGLGYFAVALTMGITSVRIGMTVFQAGLTSFLMLASAGQYAAMEVMASGAVYAEMILTTIIVNLRYVLMSCALSQKVDPKLSVGHRLLMSYAVTDELFGISSAYPGRLNPFYTYGAVTVASPGWVLGTIVGAVLGEVLPMRVVNALGIALFGMFLAVIIPPAKKNKVIAVLVVLSMACSWLFTVIPGLKEISSGFRIIILTIVLAGIAAWKFPVEEETKEDTKEATE